LSKFRNPWPTRILDQQVDGFGGSVANPAGGEVGQEFLVPGGDGARQPGQFGCPGVDADDGLVIQPGGSLVTVAAAVNGAKLLGGHPGGGDLAMIVAGFNTGQQPPQARIAYLKNAIEQTTGLAHMLGGLTPKGQERLAGLVAELERLTPHWLHIGCTPIYRPQKTGIELRKQVVRDTGIEPELRNERNEQLQFQRSARIFGEYARNGSTLWYGGKAPKFRSVMKQFGEVRQAVAERKPKRWRRNAARRSGIAIRLNKANGTYSAA
jgi:hypothetical protein